MCRNVEKEKSSSEMKYDSRMKINMTEKTSVEKTWKAYLNKIEPADRTAMELAKKRWNSVAKPIGSLGILEEDIIKIAGIRGNASGMKLDRSALAVMCADHGVVAEGVSQTGKDVTRIVAENFTKGETSTSKMCRISGTDLYPVDMGMDCEPTGQKEPDMHRILDRKVARGSGNIAREPAMSRTGCLQALLSGIDLAFRLKEMGYEILAAGEMGIGNTTPAAASRGSHLKRRPAGAPDSLTRDLRRKKRQWRWQFPVSMRNIRNTGMEQKNNMRAESCPL